MYEISLLSSASLLWMRHDRLERTRVGRGMQAKYLIGGPKASFWARSNGCVTVKAAEFQCQHDSYH